jgi:antitoxin ParD1/3/4
MYIAIAMTITLTPIQIRWLEAEVAAGRFASIDEAAQAIIEQRMAEEALAGEIDVDDLDWVKPLLDEAREGVARGETISHEEFKARAARKIAGLRK